MRPEVPGQGVRMGLQHTVRLSPAAGARRGQGRAGTALCGGRTMLTLPPGAPEFQGGNPTNSEENAELSITSTESRGLHLPSSDGDPNGCSPTSPAGDVTVTVISREKGEGRGLARSHKARSIPRKALGQTQPLGTNLLPPWLLFTDPLGPAWMLLVLSAQITPIISSLLIAGGQTSPIAFSCCPQLTSKGSCSHTVIGTS